MDKMLAGTINGVYVMNCGHSAYNKELHDEIKRLGWLEFEKSIPDGFSLFVSRDGLKVHESYQNISGGKTTEQMTAGFKQWLLPKVELITEPQWENNFFLVSIHQDFTPMFMLVYYDRIIRIRE